MAKIKHSPYLEFKTSFGEHPETYIDRVCDFSHAFNVMVDFKYGTVEFIVSPTEQKYEVRQRFLQALDWSSDDPSSRNTSQFRNYNRELVETSLENLVGAIKDGITGVVDWVETMSHAMTLRQAKPSNDEYSFVFNMLFNAGYVAHDKKLKPDEIYDARALGQRVIERFLLEFARSMDENHVFKPHDIQSAANQYWCYERTKPGSSVNEHPGRRRRGLPYKPTS